VKTLGITTVTSTRPGDLDAAVFARGTKAYTEGNTAGLLRMLEMICAVDRGDLALARPCLDSVLAAIPSPEKTENPGLAAEIAFYLAYLDGHAGRAGNWLLDTEKAAAKKKFPLVREFDYWRAVTAVRRAEGRNEEADNAWQRAKVLADRFPNVGVYEYDRDLLHAVKGLHWLQPPEVVCGLDFSPARTV
jgi:hypothetical protein